MDSKQTVVASAGDLVRSFSHFSDIALARPVVVTKNGRPRNILISVEEASLRNSARAFKDGAPKRHN